MVKKLKQLKLFQVYPAVLADFNLNTCGDPDCGNFGVAPNFAIPEFKGKNAAQRKQAASVSIPALTTGLGSYTMSSDDHHPRISEVFEYAGDPVGWDDGRSMECGHQRGNGVCDISFSIMSNEHFLEEYYRLLFAGGCLEGPVCGACGARYLENSDEFIFNGTHGKLAPGGNRRKAKPSGFRVIHRPCKGKRGARISVSLDHQAQKELRDNVRILRCIVNGDSITTMRRVLADPDTGKQIGVSRLYSRIFWLEKTLLAFERAKLKEWKQRVEASDRFSHMRIAHDDVTISVNWESRFDRRLTPLQFSVSADIRSGYVFRIDANFDPNVDPVEFFQEHYLDDTGQPTNLRQRYSRKSGVTFTAPKMHFQRPSGRFDEAMLFASAEGRWRVFSERVQNAYEKTLNAGSALPPEAQEKIAEADDKRYQLDQIRQGYFGFHDTDRDFRGSFNGSVVKPTYTKAAHLACLRDMLPKGKITLVGEQEATMVRVVPHVFRDMINEDMFEWFVISFDKEVSAPKSKERMARFIEGLEAFKERARAKLGDDISDRELLERYCTKRMKTACLEGRGGAKYSHAIANFQSRQFPQVWIKTPAQYFGETQKVVGFPVLRKKYRDPLKKLAFDQEVHDPELRAALTRRALKATIQPVSTFMSSLRHRTSPSKRAGGKGARTGPAYINGAVFNPAVLMAFLNIFRVYYNWFESRQYKGPGAAAGSESPVPAGMSSIRIPGTKKTLEVPKMATTAPVMLTPAMRLGADPEKPNGRRRKAPDPRRILYKPWLYHGTPLWGKFESR
ncbi:hypothetical protein [Mameliella alba]|uniref:hypothetical protein n=1 Tax=Mameliella alba TaxID=561184 RepID=UPI00142FDC55|nr:hypothetical protein [Mameliella alba]